MKNRFTRTVPNKYSYVDQQRGYILVRDRSGAEVRAGLISLAVTVIHSSTHNFTDARQIAELAALAGRSSS